MRACLRAYGGARVRARMRSTTSAGRPPAPPLPTLRPVRLLRRPGRSTSCRPCTRRGPISATTSAPSPS
eukprot:2318963-Alexandrium_andersonii.AAC.1